MPAFAIPAKAGPHFTDPGEVRSWVGLATTAVSKQSAQDRYVTDIEAVSPSRR